MYQPVSATRQSYTAFYYTKHSTQSLIFRKNLPQFFIVRSIADPYMNTQKYFSLKQKKTNSKHTQWKHHLVMFGGRTLSEPVEFWCHNPTYEKIYNHTSHMKKYNHTFIKNIIWKFKYEKVLFKKGTFEIPNSVI